VSSIPVGVLCGARGVRCVGCSAVKRYDTVKNEHRVELRNQDPVSMTTMSDPRRALSTEVQSVATGHCSAVTAVLDTEFTSFESPALLSVGLVLLSGTAELYLEVDPDSPLGRGRRAASSQFVREVVAPQMGFARAAACTTEAHMAQRILEWLQLNNVTHVLADAEIDFVLLHAIEGLPKDIATTVVEAEYRAAHQALEDARRLAAAFKAGHQ
jgi:hypothetical protein